MAIRIDELAKELGVASRALVDKAIALGLDVVDGNSAVDDKQARKLGMSIMSGKINITGSRKKKATKKKATKKVAKKATKKVATKAVEKEVAKKVVVKKAARKVAKKAVKKAVKKVTRKVAKKVVEEVAEKTEVKVPEKPARKAVKKAAKKAVKKAVKKATKKVVTKAPGKVKAPVEPTIVKQAPAEPEKPKDVPISERPLTARKKKPPRAARVIYRPGQKGAPPIKKTPIKKRSVSAPVAKVKLAPQHDVTKPPDLTSVPLPDEQEKGQRRIDRERHESKRFRPEGTMPRPRVPFRRRLRHIATKRRPKVVAPKPTHADLVSPVSIKGFSAALGIKANVIIGKLMAMNIMASINQPLDDEVVQLLADELSVKVTLKRPKDPAQEIMERRAIEDKPEDLAPRAPIVTFLGHVDHGKTSLLDAIRQANVVAGESGGITQHIGAYKVTTSDGKSVVFLDTPGHKAFTEMRARGANVTDVAVLVVAADDGVMPQTEEAINHAKDAGVPIVVALNKIDLPSANVDKATQQLSGHDLLWVKWGGKTEIVECSATQNMGLDDLVETLSLEAEMLELKANPNRPADGMVIEALSSKGRGVTTTVLVQNGTLHVGDVLLCGRACGRVRAMYDDKGVELQEAGPSTPVSVTGFTVVPEAGDSMYVMDDIAQAKAVAEETGRRMRQESMSARPGLKLEDLFDYISESKLSELSVIIKADVKGSLEVLRKTVQDIPTDEVRVRVLHAAVGGVNESDVLLAHASNAIIIGFHVAPDEKARLLAEKRGVDIRLYQVIYEIGDEIKKAVEGMLAPDIKEVVDGHVEVREIFKVSRLGTIAGCYVTDGTVNRQGRVRVVRDGLVITDGTIDTLRRFKDDVREVRSGFECGIKVAGYDDIKVGDQFEIYHKEEIARTL